MLRTKTLDTLLNCHRLFACGNTIASIILALGSALLFHNVCHFNTILSIILAFTISTVSSLISAHIIDKTLIKMYNQQLTSDTVRLSEMLITGQLIEEDQYKKLVLALIECEKKLSEKS
jgi:hypothetical protein